MKQEPIIQETVSLANSEIKKIADRVVNTIILAAEKVSVETDFKPAKDTFEAIIQERLNFFDEKKIKDIKKRVSPVYNASTEVRTSLYGELGKIALKDIKSVELEEKLLSPVAINRTVLGLWKPPAGLDISAVEMNKMSDLQSEIFNTHNITSIDAITGGGRVFSDIGLSPDDLGVKEEDDFEPQAVTDKLALYIRRIKCVDETNPEWWGHDEIALGGASVDETGDTKKISEKYIGGGFDDGDTKWYSPIWRWHWFGMREGGNNWPKSYFLTFVLAEKDMGGLANFLQKLWEKVKKYVLDAIAAAIGGAIGSSFGPLGTIIGAAVGYIVAKVVEWFINVWKDDIFPPKTISCTVPGYGARWSRNGHWGYTTSSYRRAHFYGHGGHYYVEYYWRLFS